MKVLRRIRRWWHWRKNPYKKVIKQMAANAREVKKKVARGELPRYEAFYDYDSERVEELPDPEVEGT